MKTAELFVKCLENEGVKYIFGVPGEENAHLMMALESSSIQFILTRHEQGAAFMADVYGRLTGEAGVCLATLGPGATNLVTGVADGNMDRAPMVVITAQASTQRQHKESHQVMDIISMFKPLTKWASPISHPDNTPEVVRKAFKIATMEKPGACLIELAEDVAKDSTLKNPISRRKLRRPVPANKIIDEAVALIKKSRRPVILAGNGCIRKRASSQLRELAERTKIGVINTFMAKGAVSRHAPNSLFTVGLQAKDVIACAIDAADLVIAIGYDLVEYHPRLWNVKGDKKIIHIDFLPAEVDDSYQVDVEIVGDIAHSLWLLGESLGTSLPSFENTQHQMIRETMLAEFSAYKDDAGRSPIRPQKVLWDIRDVLGAQDILVCDVGAHKMWTARYYQCDEPNTCIISNGFCSMGFALPGAIAAKLACPSPNVVAVCGDGGFLMNVQEMETAARLRTKITVIVWDDGGYGLIAWKQKNEFGKHTKLNFGNPDFVKLANAFGWEGFRVKHSSDFKDVLIQALRCDKPSLVSLPIDYRENGLLTERLGNIVCPI